MVRDVVSAAPPPIVVHDVTLRWTSAAGCIGDRELADAVLARLGEAAHPVRQRVVIDGELVPSATGWTASIRTTDEHGAVLGQRELHEPAASCREIDDKLVLVIALIIDPELFEEPSPPAVKPAPVVLISRERWRFGAGVAALVAGGLLPGLAAGTALTATIEPPHVWPIEIAAVLWPYDRGTASPGGAKLLELTGGVALCPHILGPLSACVGAQAGEVRARGFGFDRNQLQHEVVAHGTAMVWLERLVTSGVGARLGAGLWVPLSRPKFVAREGALDVVIYQPAPVAVVSEIALWIRF